MPPYSFPRICHHKLLNRALYDSSLVSDSALLIHKIEPDRATKANLVQAGLLPEESMSAEDRLLCQIFGEDERQVQRQRDEHRQQIRARFYSGTQIDFPVVHTWTLHYIDITYIHVDPINSQNAFFKDQDALKRIIPIRGAIDLTQSPTWEKLIASFHMDMPHYSIKLPHATFLEKVKIYQPLFYSLYPFARTFCAASINTAPTAIPNTHIFKV